MGPNEHLVMERDNAEGTVINQTCAGHLKGRGKSLPLGSGEPGERAFLWDQMNQERLQAPPLPDGNL